ncbi:MAG: hypothetical protein ABI358_01955 [Ginsengibacter sp.]
MKTRYLLIAGLAIGFSSCSTAYRMGQTPDDVYYSPAPPQEEYVTTNNQQEKDGYGYNNQSNGEDFSIRRGITNPVYRNYNSLDFGYGYDPYAYNSSLYSPYSNINPYGYSGVTFYPYNYYNSYNAFNNYGNYYSPYNFYSPVYYNLKPGNATSNYSGPRRYNLGAYGRNANTSSGYVTPATSSNSSVPVRTFTPPAPTNTTGVGSFIRRIFTPNNNNTERNTYINNNRNTDNNTNDRPARSFQPSSAGSNNSSSSGGGGSAPVRTFRK